MNEKQKDNNPVHNKGGRFVLGLNALGYMFKGWPLCVCCAKWYTLVHMSPLGKQTPVQTEPDSSVIPVVSGVTAWSSIELRQIYTNLT